MRLDLGGERVIHPEVDKRPPRVGLHDQTGADLAEFGRALVHPHGEPASW